MNAILFAIALHVVNANVQPLSSLRAAPANGWIGYTMHARSPVHISCCGGCSLDSDCMSINRGDSNDDIHLAGDEDVAIFARMQGGAVDRIRVFSALCNVDASGQTVYWADNVPPAASITFLRDAVEHGTDRGRNTAIFALSLHADGTDTLIDLAKHHPDREVRGKALFWLAQQAGQKAVETLKDAVDNDPEESVRSKAVFGISQLPNGQSIPLLVDLMKHNRSREVRKKAAFWLGQKNDPRAVQAIEDILLK